MERSNDSPPSPWGDANLTVFYDGSCPLCRREIGFYRRRAVNADIEWCDVSSIDDGDLPDDLDREKAMARFHVARRDGALISGGRAFATLWSVVPGFKRLGRAAGMAPFPWLLDRLYDLFLRFRPKLQRMARG